MRLRRRRLEPKRYRVQIVRKPSPNATLEELRRREVELLAAYLAARRRREAAEAALKLKGQGREQGQEQEWEEGR